VTSDQRLMSEHFPRSSQYHPDWVVAGASGGANVLWVTEWLTSALDLHPGMKVLDLGCGRASSSIFMRREFGVQVWATDLWFSADNEAEITALEADRGRCLGYARLVGHRRGHTVLSEQIESVPAQYTRMPLLRPT
jgi:hypothetical protein